MALIALGKWIAGRDNLALSETLNAHMKDLAWRDFAVAPEAQREQLFKATEGEWCRRMKPYAEASRALATVERRVGMRALVVVVVCATVVGVVAGGIRDKFIHRARPPRAQ